MKEIREELRVERDGVITIGIQRDTRIEGADLRGIEEVRGDPEGRKVERDRGG